MSDKVTTQSQYELFQEWLNDCPVQIESYEDNVDSVYVRFDIEVEEEKVIITPQQLEGDISTVTDSDYADKVDTLVGNMVASNDNVFTHDSEGC
jgi:hypothetical protein